MKTTPNYFILRLLTIVFLGTFLASCVLNPVTGKREISLMGEEGEMAMGMQADPEVVAEFGLFEDKKLQAYIDQQGQKMARISHRPDLNYEFKIVNSPVVNAFALPGFVYFTRGILAHFNNEAEFAGVLGHEIGHITRRHSAQQYTTTMLAQFGMIAGMVLSPTVAQFAEELSQGVQLALLSNSRKHESEADELGVEYSTKIGYDANKMADFFRTIGRISKASGGDQIPDFLSTHPNPDDRFVRVHQLADEMQNKLQLPRYKVDRDSYMALIDGLIYGEDPREGYVDNNVFYHPAMRFYFPYPNGWMLNNAPSQVQMAPREQNALMIFSFAPGSTLNEAAQNFAQQFQLNVVETNNKTVNEYPSFQMVADQDNQEDPSQSVRLLAYFYQDQSNNNTIFYMLGVAPKQGFSAMSNYFLFTMDNFRKLTDPARINVSPDYIRIVEVPYNMTFEQVMRQYNMPTQRFEELAILNSMELNETIPAKTKIKILSKNKTQTPGGSILN